MSSNYFLDNYIKILLEFNNSGILGDSKTIERYIYNVIIPRLELIDFYEKEAKSIQEEYDKSLNRPEPTKTSEMSVHTKYKLLSIFRLLINDAYEISRYYMFIYLGRNGYNIKPELINNYRNIDRDITKYGNLFDSKKTSQISSIRKFMKNIAKIRQNIIHNEIKDIILDDGTIRKHILSDGNELGGKVEDSIRLMKVMLGQHSKEFIEILKV